MKKGFTLIELLVVIIILGLVALIAIPSVLNNLKKTSEDLYNTQLDLIKAGAANYVADQIAHPTDGIISLVIKNKDTSPRKFKLSVLQEAGAVEYNISNPLCDGENKYFSPNNTCVMITYNGKEFSYEVVSCNASNDLKTSCTRKL